MGKWGIGLYSDDFATDLKATIAAVCRLPVDEESLVAAVCRAEQSAATDPADEDHTSFWLVLADQFEKRGIFSERVRRAALTIIDDGRDGAVTQALGMRPADIRKRTEKLAELRARLLAQPEASAARKTLSAPQPYVFELHGVYAYPTRRGEPMNPYLSAKRFDRPAWHPDGFGLIFIVGRGRAFGYLAWYSAVKASAVVAAVPDRETLVGDIRWAAPPFYGTCNPSHFRKLELSEIGVFPVEPAEVGRCFPHLATGEAYAIGDISIANRMKIGLGEARRWWRRPDGKMEPIAYPPAPTLNELGPAG